MDRASATAAEPVGTETGGAGSPADVLSVSMQLDALDTVRAYQLHNRDQLWRKPSLIALVVTSVLLLIFLTAAIDDKPAIAVIFALGLLGGFAAPRLMIRWYIPRAARRIHQQQRSLQDPIDLVFQTEGLRGASPASSSFTPWTHYRKMREDQYVFLFYQSDALFQFIPKRLLPDTGPDFVRRLYQEARGAVTK